MDTILRPNPDCTLCMGRQDLQPCPECLPPSPERNTALNELLDTLDSALVDLLDYHQYNPQGADYRCTFCHTLAKTNHDSVEHPDNCTGKKLEALIQKLRA